VGNIVKRIFDFILALAGLVVLSPFFALLAALIKRDSPGPVFYHGPRVGRNGKVFLALKFRTMHETPESHSGTRVTAGDDPRVTPLGRWLRDTKLNELPQLWNVVKGDMSLVGPRPEDPEIVVQWPERVRAEILTIRPGITSPASVLYRNEEQMLSASSIMDDYLLNILPDKLRLDVLYVRTRNFLSDLDILLWTFIAILIIPEKRTVPETLLYAGPLSRFIRRYFSWFLIDCLVAFGSVGVVGIIWRSNGPLNLGLGVSIGIAITIALLFSVINSMLGLGRISWPTARSSHVFDLAFSSGIATLLLYLINGLWPSGMLFPSGMTLEIGIFTFLGFVIARYRQRLITGLISRVLQYRSTTSTLGERVLIIGAGECGQLAAWLIHKSNLSMAFSIVGMIDDDPLKQNRIIDGYPVLGTTREIPTLVKRRNIGLIMFAISKIESADRDRILAICRQASVRMLIIPDLIKVVQNYLLKQTREVPRDVSPIT
jgi:lipopolysaccharide/colanic/teichoic acid biosynthesis glycosyltransferase